ncbi:MAG TPA: hypothetical protein DCE14_05345 [Kosmotogaceae bacterium]|nr:MAG: Uncharacterized protein XE05_0447 [Thermotogales bacterium 46_20]HAA85764.1 hypothetical protein [Kosmotogaceae bacterium]
MKLFRAFDLMVILIMAITFLLFFPAASNGAEVAHVFQDGQMIRTVDLFLDSLIEIGDALVLQVEKGAVRVVEANCPDQICVKTGWTSSPGIPIVCIPNRIMIVIPRKNDQAIDVITG